MKKRNVFLFAVSGTMLACTGMDPNICGIGKDADGNDILIPCAGSPSYGGKTGTGGALPENGGSPSSNGGSAGSAGSLDVAGSTGIAGNTATGGSEPTGGTSGEGGAAGTGGVLASGGTASGGVSAEGGHVSTGGTDSSGGVTAAGGTETSGGMSGTGGTSGSSATGGSSSGGTGTGGTTGATPYVTYLGPTQNLGEVGCGTWIGGDPADPSDPLNQIPSYGTYAIVNPTSSDVTDFWIRFGITPFYPNGGTYSYAYGYFDTAYVSFSTGQTRSFRLDGASLNNAYPNQGTVWGNITSGSSTSPLIIPAISMVEFRVAATLCPRVKEVVPGEPEFIVPPVGTSVSVCVGSYLFGNNPTGEVSGPCFDSMRTFGASESE